MNRFNKLILNGKSYLMIFISTLLLYGIYLRYNILDSHFSHIDDLLPAIEESKQSKFDTCNLKNVKFHICQNLFFKVSENTTYAPFQFLITDFFLNNPKDYKSCLFNSRLPSFLFFIMGIFMFYLVTKSINKKNNLLFFAFGSFVFTFSWMSIIYSVQSSSYIIGVFAALTIFYFILNESRIINQWKRYLIFLLIGCLPLLQYQILIFIIAYLITKTIQLLFKVNAKNVSEQFVEIGLLFLSTLTCYVFFIQKYNQRGINWNSGINNEFLFSIHEKNIFQNIKYLVLFVIKNSFIVFQAITSPFNESNYYPSFIWSAVGIFMVLFGFIKTIKNHDKQLIFFAYYSLTIIVLWLILILYGKLALSPTRHNLILLSLIIIYFSVGILELIICVSTKNINSIALVILCVLMVSFSMQKDKELSLRKDSFDEKEFSNLITKFQIDLIIGEDWTANHLFTNIVKANYSRCNIKENLINKQSSFVVIRNSTQGINRLLILSHRKKIIIDNFEKFSPKVIFNMENYNFTEICPSKRTSNGTNSLFIKILEFPKDLNLSPDKIK